MSEYVFSPSQLKFYPYSLYNDYQAAGRWPSDAVPVGEGTWAAYTQNSPPAGMQLGVGEFNQPAWVTSPPSPPPTRQEQAQAATSAGCQVTSSISPELNGTWALDLETLNQIMAVALSVSSGLGLPGGGATFYYPDKSRTPHPLTVVSAPKLFQTLRDYTYAIQLYGSGQTPSLPAQPTVVD